MKALDKHARIGCDCSWGKRGRPRPIIGQKKVFSSRPVPDLINVENPPSEQDPRSLSFDGHIESRQC